MEPSSHTIIGTKIKSLQPNEDIFDAIYAAKNPIITDHRVYGAAVVPGSLHLARLIAVVFLIYKQNYLDITEILFKNPLVLKDETVRRVRLILNKDADKIVGFTIISIDINANTEDEQQWVLHAQRKCNTHSSGVNLKSPADNLKFIAKMQKRCKDTIALKDFDNYFFSHKLTYGSSFKWFTKIQFHGSEALSYMREPTVGPEMEDFILSPGQIDCSFQAFIGIIFDAAKSAPETDAWILGGMRRIRIYNAPQGKLICYNQLPHHEQFDPTTRKAVGQITIYDDKGNLIADFEDVLVIKASPEKMNRFAH